MSGGAQRSTSRRKEGTGPWTSPPLNGYIKLHRQLLRHPIWALQPGPTKVLFACLLLANYLPGCWDDGSETVSIAPGEYLTSEQHLADAAQVTREVVRRALRQLKRLGTITTRKKKGHWTVIRFVNWDTYQHGPTDWDPTDNQPSTNRQPQLKKEKNSKNSNQVGSEGREGRGLEAPAPTDPATSQVERHAPRCPSKYHGNGGQSAPRAETPGSASEPAPTTGDSPTAPVRRAGPRSMGTRPLPGEVGSAVPPTAEELAARAAAKKAELRRLAEQADAEGAKADAHEAEGEIGLAIQDLERAVRIAEKFMAGAKGFATDDETYPVFYKQWFWNERISQLRSRSYKQVPTRFERLAAGDQAVAARAAEATGGPATADSTGDAIETEKLAWSYAVEANRWERNAVRVKDEGAPQICVVRRYQLALHRAGQAFELLPVLPSDVKWSEFATKVEDWRVRLEEARTACERTEASDTRAGDSLNSLPDGFETFEGTLRVNDPLTGNPDWRDEPYTSGLYSR